MKAFRISDEAVVCMATAPLAMGAPFRLVIADADRKRTVVASSAVAQGARRLIYAICNSVGTDGRLAFLGASGTALTKMAMPSVDSLPWLDLEIAVGAIEQRADQLAFLRRIAESAPAYLGQDGTADPSSISRMALERVTSAATACTVERRFDLGGGLTLWHLRGVSSSEITSVQLQGNAELRTSPFRPITGLDSATAWADEDGVESFLLTDIGAGQFGTARILMWGRDNLWVANVRDVHWDSRAELVSMLQGLGSSAYRLIRYLAVNLSAYLQSRTDLNELLREVRTVIPARPGKALMSEQPIGAGVDLAVVTADGKLFVSGWISDPNDVIARLSWVHPAEVKIPISQNWARTPRPKLPERYRNRVEAPEAYGFVVTIDGAGPGKWLTNQLFELELRSGATFELVAPPAPRAAALARDAILQSVDDDSYSDEDVRRAVEPAVASSQREHLSGERVKSEISIGESPTDPALSVIIPIYKALEFLRYQIAAFALDPDFKDVEIVYVLDSPEQADDVEARLRAMHALYGMPFLLVVHTRNLGYAPAVNTGVSRSRGDTLILMNSDVVPVENGWVRTLRKRLKKSVGAVGPKLLFHDESIQHAGLSFDRDLQGRYFNKSDGKGWPRHYPPANRFRAVTALTGACLILRRSVYDQVGGICEDYVVGDFEDTDFCLRIAALSKTLCYEPVAELYHYERQSISQNDSYTTTSAASYNRWLHTGRWREVLETHAGRSKVSEGTDANAADGRGAECGS